MTKLGETMWWILPNPTPIQLRPPDRTMMFGYVRLCVYIQ